MRLLRWVLDGLGLLALIAIAAWVYFAVRSSMEDNRPIFTRQVAFVLPIAGLPTETPVSVVWSRRSAYSPFNADGLTAHCIELGSFSPTEDAARSWVFGPDPSPLLNSVRNLVSENDDVLARCFGNVDLSSPNLGARIRWIRFFNDRATDAELVLYYRPLRRLLYVTIAT